MGDPYSLGPDLSDGKARCVLRHIIGNMAPQGYALEFGVGCGDSLRMIAGHMPAVGFDSFAGLPEDWRPGYSKGAFAGPPPMIANTRLVIGWFADTLPCFDFATVNPIGLVHFDADLYSSTVTALQWVGPHLQPGTICVFDEWHGYPGCEDGEALAWREHAELTGITWRVIGHDDQAWGIEVSCG